jgi:malate dehydrogenase
VGNPANTNCLIALNHAKSVPSERFCAMTRLDHNRAAGQLAAKAKVSVTEVTNVTIWGNHSATQFPDFFNAKIGGKPAPSVITDKAWLEGEFISTVQKRGAAIIEARGLSSAASAANAAIDHVRDWVKGSREGDWVSMGIPSDGSYGIPEGVMYGYPVTCKGGKYEIVKGIDISDFARKRMDATLKELHEERDGIKALLG